MKPKLVIFDLDGTLADASHRQHLVNRAALLESGRTPDWRGFYAACGDDKPMLHTIAVAKALHSAGFELWLFSGRSAEVRDLTMRWLSSNALTELFHNIRMRPERDYTPDDKLKMQWHDAMSQEDRDRLMLVFDDRNRMVQAWRARGVPCFQVADGAF